MFCIVGSGKFVWWGARCNLIDVNGVFTRDLQGTKIGAGRLSPFLEPFTAFIQPLSPESLHTSQSQKILQKESWGKTFPIFIASLSIPLGSKKQHQPSDNNTQLSSRQISQ
jgi:hypothetical protein